MINLSTHNLPAFSLTYVSSAVELFSTQDLVDLLDTCRTNNTASGITGMLLYKDGNFMQVLEGEEESVWRLHEKIARDPRHTGLITLLEGEIPTRQFAEWSMGFRHLTDPDVRDLPGYTEFLSTGLNSSEFIGRPSRTRKLLATFKTKM